MNLYVDHTGEPEVDHTGEPPLYGRVPISVMSDRRLKASDVRVFAAVASPVFQGRTSSIGLSELSKLSTLSRRKVHESLVRLESCGHIRKVPQGKGRRMIYLLLSSVFGQQQGKVDVVISSPRGKRLVSVSKTA